jgi:glycerol-3-phosphate acyltransferase PlsY
LGAFYLSLNSTQISIIAIISVIGHIYPIYTRFKGGKGVATALGCLFTLHPLIGCIFIATWLLIVRITQYASVASLGALLMAWLISIFLIPTYGIAIAIIFILVFAKHRDNLRKLLNGKENKLKL